MSAEKSKFWKKTSVARDDTLQLSPLIVLLLFVGIVSLTLLANVDGRYASDGPGPMPFRTSLEGSMKGGLWRTNERISGGEEAFSVPPGQLLPGSPFLSSKAPGTPKDEGLTEIEKLRGPETKFYRTPAGRKVARIWTTPVHWRDENGDFREYNTSVTENGDPVFQYVSRQNSLTGSFVSELVPEGPTAKIGVGGGEILFRAEKMALVGSGTGLRVFPRRTRGTIRDNIVEYDEIYPGVAERYTILPDRIKNEFVIKERPSYSREAGDPKGYLVFYTEVAISPDLVPVLPTNFTEPPGTRTEFPALAGSYAQTIFFRARGQGPSHGTEQVARIPRPHIYDSGRIGGEPGGPRTTSEIYSDYHILARPGSTFSRFRLGVRVPLSYLLAPTTVYPVHIDPTVEKIRTGDGTGKDAFICGYNGPLGDNRGWNMGGADEMYVSPETADYYKVFRSLVDFDLSTVGNEDAEFFSNASLNAYCSYDEDQKPSQGLEVSIYRIERDWVEGANGWGADQDGTGATWLTSDGNDEWGQPGGDHGPSPVDRTWVNDYDWFRWDSGEVVGKWLKGGSSAHGFLLEGTSSGQVLKRFRTSESGQTAQHPYLELEFFARPSLEGADISPTVAVNNTPVSFEALYNDPDHRITGYIWESDLDGVLSTREEFTLSNLSVGTHGINLTILGPGNFSMSDRVGSVEIVELLPGVWNLSAFDTPKDQGGSITVVWDYGEFDNFRKYGIHITSGTQGAPLLLTPEMTLNDMGRRSAEIETLGGLPLTNGEQYMITVVPRDTYGFYNDSPPVAGPVSPADNLPPPRVENVLAEDTPGDQGGSLSISWSPLPPGPEGSGEEYFHHYNVYVEKHPFDNLTGTEPVADDITDRTVSSYIVRSLRGRPLEDGRDHYVAVTAVDGYGNEAGNVTCYGPVRSGDDLPPGRVSNLIATDRPSDQGNAVWLEWDASKAPDLDHYNVYLSLDPISSVEGMAVREEIAPGKGNRVRCDIEGVPNDVPLYFAVTGADRQGNEHRTGTAKVRTRALDNIAPPVVTSFTAKDTPEDHGGNISLTWDPSPVEDLGHYSIYGNRFDPITDPGSAGLVANITDPDITSLIIRGLEGGRIEDNTNYYFAIMAEDVNGNRNISFASAGPVRSVDNVPPRIADMLRGNISVLNATLIFNSTYFEENDTRLWEGNVTELALSLVLESRGDVCEVSWKVDGTDVGRGPNVSVNLSKLAGGNHTITAEVYDAPFLLSSTLKLTLGERVVEAEKAVDENGASWWSRWPVLLGVTAALLLGLIPVLIYRKRRRKNKKKERRGDARGARGEEGGPVGPRAGPDKRLAKICVKKKVKIVTGRKVGGKGGKKVAVKDKLHYLEDAVRKQFETTKRSYGPEGDEQCPMRNLSRNEFECPVSVVEKCGLDCSQKEELGIVEGIKGDTAEGAEDERVLPAPAEPLDTERLPEGGSEEEEIEELKRLPEGGDGAEGKGEEDGAEGKGEGGEVYQPMQKND